MNLSQRFLLNLAEDYPAPARPPIHRAAIVAAMNKAFSDEFGRAAWTQVDVGFGRCSQSNHDGDAESWNRALVAARDANYRPENLT